MTLQINSISWLCYFLSHTQLSPCWYSKTDSWTIPRWVLTGEHNERRRARECDGESQTSNYSDEFMGSRLHLSLLFLPICFIVPSNIFSKLVLNCFPQDGTCSVWYDRGTKQEWEWKAKMSRRGIQRNQGFSCRKLVRHGVRRYRSISLGL